MLLCALLFFQCMRRATVLQTATALKPSRQTRRDHVWSLRRVRRPGGGHRQLLGGEAAAGSLLTKLSLNHADQPRGGTGSPMNKMVYHQWGSSRSRGTDLMWRSLSITCARHYLSDYQMSDLLWFSHVVALISSTEDAEVQLIIHQRKTFLIWLDLNNESTHFLQQDKCDRSKATDNTAAACSFTTEKTRRHSWHSGF